MMGVGDDDDSGGGVGDDGVGDDDDSGGGDSGNGDVMMVIMVMKVNDGDDSE